MHLDQEYAISKIKSHQDIEECVYMHLNQNDPSFISATFSAAMASMYSSLRSGSFVRVIRYRNKPVAWIVAEIAVSRWSGLRTLNQVCFGSSLTGAEAICAIQLLHQELVNYAEKIKIQHVTSASSFVDTKNVFVRALIPMGWKVKGYMAIYFTSHHK